MIKKIMAVIATTVIALGAFTGCGKSAAESKDVDILNFKAPVSGEEIAVVKIKDFGTVKIKLFPDEVPKGVENFKGLVEKKYYDELIFHRVVGNFVIQTGDPKGNGTGGSSIWGEDFEPELNDGLRNFYGSVGYAT
ncbi:MAG: peptidylprolyl isomerase, partial [Oscillospiraceae bacterium]